MLKNKQNIAISCKFSRVQCLSSKNLRLSGILDIKADKREGSEGQISHEFIKIDRN